MACSTANLGFSLRLTAVRVLANGFCGGSLSSICFPPHCAWGAVLASSGPQTLSSSPSQNFVTRASVGGAGDGSALSGHGNGGARSSSERRN